MESIALIERLVGFETVSRDSNLPLIEFVESYLDDHGVASRRVPSHDGHKSNLIATVGPEEEGGVVLSGHTDVVPIDGQDWSSDPFVIRRDARRLYGRGTCDMKGFIAIALALVPQMTKLRRPVHFALSYDEEVGCLGAPDMIDVIRRELPPTRGVIVGEPTRMQAVTGHKGIVGLRTTVTGYEAHSSQTHRGVSAVMTAARLVSHLEGVAHRLSETTSRDNGFEPHATSVHVGVIKGGTALNIISGKCEFTWDIRNIPGEDPQTLIDAFEVFCRTEVLPGMRARHSACDIQTRVLAQCPAFEDSSNPILSLVQSLTGNEVTHKVAYTAEAGQYQGAGFPTVLCGPGSIDQAHQPDEFIEESEVEAGERFLRSLIADLEAA
ncbi:MAG: acetylornithine deacetylase [Arenicellales bacterium]|jgi:acetylornithine deacetylase